MNDIKDFKIIVSIFLLLFRISLCDKSIGIYIFSIIEVVLENIYYSVKSGILAATPSLK